MDITTLQHHQPELPSSYMYTGPITHTTPGAVMATLQSVKAPNPLLPIQNPSIPLSVSLSRDAYHIITRQRWSTENIVIPRTS